jgi:O-antigen ligase
LAAVLTGDWSSDAVILMAAATGAAITAFLAVYEPAMAVAILALAYPFDITAKVGPLKLTTSGAMMAVIALVWAVQRVRARGWTWQVTPLDLPVIAFAGATVLSLLSGTGNFDQQLIGVLKSFGGFLIFFMVTQTVKQKRDAWLILGAVVLAGVLQAGWISSQVLLGNQVVSDTSRATGTIIDPNILAGYLILLIPLLVAVGLSFRRRSVLIGTALAFIVLGIALAATLSRSGWLGMGVATIALVMLFPKERWKVLLLVGGVAVILVGVGLLGPVADRLNPNGTQSPVSMFLDRYNVWTASIVMFAQHPIFGVGVMNFVNFLPSNSIQGTEILPHAHNIFLNMAAERGVIGLVTFAVVVVILFRTLWRTLPLARSRQDHALVAGLLAMFAGYFAHSMFEVSYYDYKVLLLFWILVGLSVVMPRLLSDGTEAVQDSARMRLIPETVGSY